MSLRACERRMKSKKYAVLKMISILAAIILLCGCAGTQENSKHFQEQSERVRNEFAYSEYTEVMGNESHILLVPEKSNIVGLNDNYLVDQKLFVFKSQQKGGVIVLQMTSAPEAKDRWRNSFNYEPHLFNAPDCNFGKEIMSDVPDAEVSVLSFAYGKINYCVMVLDSAGENSSAATLAVDFCNALLLFLKDIQ